jgi:hypothetical protein
MNFALRVAKTFPMYRLNTYSSAKWEALKEKHTSQLDGFPFKPLASIITWTAALAAGAVSCRCFCNQGTILRISRSPQIPSARLLVFNIKGADPRW